jgi:hypothetical protein
MAQAVETVVLASVSTGAGAFLSAAVDLLDYEGIVRVTQNLGLITGSISIPVLTQSDTSGGTYVALTTDGAFGVAQSLATSVTFDASSAKRFIKYSTTVTTGPILWGITAVGFKKYR